jgi:hypothetical protein
VWKKRTHTQHLAGEEVVVKGVDVLLPFKRRSATATARTVSSVNVDSGTNRLNLADFVPRCSCTDPMISPAIAPNISTPLDLTTAAQRRPVSGSQRTHRAAAGWAGAARTLRRYR